MPFLNGIDLVCMISHTFNLKSRLVNSHPMSWRLQIHWTMRCSSSAVKVPSFPRLRDLVLPYNQSSRLDLGMPNFAAALLIFIPSSTTAMAPRRSSSFQFPFFHFFTEVLLVYDDRRTRISSVWPALSLSRCSCMYSSVEPLSWLAWLA
jgi:hypothetical protein